MSTKHMLCALLFHALTVMYPLGDVPFLLLHVCESWSAVTNILQLPIRGEGCPCRRRHGIDFLVIAPSKLTKDWQPGTPPPKASEIPVHKPGGWEWDLCSFL